MIKAQVVWVVGGGRWAVRQAVPMEPAMPLDGCVLNPPLAHSVAKNEKTVWSCN